MNERKGKRERKSILKKKQIEKLRYKERKKERQTDRHTERKKDGKKAQITRQKW